MKTLKEFLDFIIAYPTLGTIILIVFGVLGVVYRKQIKQYLSYKFKWLKDRKVEKLSVFCDDTGEFFDFKSHVVIPEYKVLYNSLMKQIKKSRKEGSVLKFNMSNIEQINHESEEAIRDAIREMIFKNNIRCRIIFPNKTMKTTYIDVNRLLKDRDCKSIDIKKATKNKIK